MSGRTAEGDEAQATVPAAAVAAPRAHGRVPVEPRHLYRAVLLFFVLSALLRYLPQLIYVALLLYAAVILAVAFNAIVRRLPLQRAWVAGLLGIALLAALVAVLWFGVPVLLAQVRNLAAQLPAMEQQAREAEQWLREQTGLNLRLMRPGAAPDLGESFLGGGISSALSNIGGLLGAILLPFLVLVGALYAVAHPNRQLLEPLLRAVPRETRPALRRSLELLGERLLGWIKGTLISMAAVGLLSWLLFVLIGLPNALLLAVLAALFEFIPLIGPWIAGAVAVIAAALIDPTKALWTAAAALAVQQVEGYLITPFAMRHAADVHPFITIFALLFFGNLFGFLGVLLALPLTFLVWTLVEVFWVERALDTDEDRIAPVVQE